MAKEARRVAAPDTSARHVWRAIPRMILTTEHPDAPFNSFSVLRAPSDGAPVCKVFSRHPLPDSVVQELFEDVELVRRVPWKAYPHLPPLRGAPDGHDYGTAFEVAPGLYHLNAAESVASALEVSAVAARNVAALVGRRLGLKRKSGAAGDKDEL